MEWRYRSGMKKKGGAIFFVSVRLFRAEILCDVDVLEKPQKRKIHAAVVVPLVCLVRAQRFFLFIGVF